MAKHVTPPPPPQVLCECMGSRMTSHDWFLLSFLGTCCTKYKIHIITLIHEWFASDIRLEEWPRYRFKQPRWCSTFNFPSNLRDHSVRSSKWQQIVWNASQSAQWVQLSISHFPLFISIFCLASICSDIDLSISHCPPLFRMLVVCGGVQRIAQRDNPSVG